MVAQGLASGRGSFVGSSAQVAARPCRPRIAHRPATTAALTVRPYTVRKGDTLESIAEKRDVTMKELLALNHGIDPAKVEESQTILLPAGRLSARDREILQGIGSRTYRTYPVRGGETIDDIISKRGISRAEAEALNPDVNLDKLISAQIIKLPAGKYTVREREMLSGVAGAPESYFMPGNVFSNSIYGALLFGITYSAWLFRQKDDPDDEEDQQLA